MSILVLSRASLKENAFDTWLNDRSGGDIVVLASKEKMEAASERAEDFAGRYAHLEVFENYDLSGLIEWRAIQLHKRFNFTHIVATAEFDLQRASRLRHRFELPGQDEASASAFRDKLEMKGILADAGIAVAAQHGVSHVGEVYDFSSQNGYPIVLKPRSGAASVGIQILRSERELEVALASGLSSEREVSPSLMVEDYVDGTMYHVDGLVVNGQLILICPSQYFNDSLVFAEGLALGSSMLDTNDPLCGRLRDLIRAVLVALPTPSSTTFHAEVFHTRDDRLVVCEIASRTGGGRINDTLRYAFGIDMNASWIRAQAGIVDDLPPWDDTSRSHSKCHGWLSIPPRKNCYLAPKAPPPFSWVVDFKNLAKPDVLMGVAKNNADHIAGMVVIGESQGEVRDNLDVLQHWVSDQFIEAR